jgi:hypothetical protein
VKIGRAVDELRAEPSLQDVTAPLVTSVDPLGVHPVELPHRGGEVALRRLEQQAVVVAHQAVGVAANAISRDERGQHDQEARAVRVVLEDRLPVVAPRGYVIDTAGER